MIIYSDFVPILQFVAGINFANTWKGFYSIVFNKFAKIDDTIDKIITNWSKINGIQSSVEALKENHKLPDSNIDKIQQAENKINDILEKVSVYKTDSTIEYLKIKKNLKIKESEKNINDIEKECSFVKDKSRQYDKIFLYAGIFALFEMLFIALFESWIWREKIWNCFFIYTILSTIYFVIVSVPILLRKSSCESRGALLWSIRLLFLSIIFAVFIPENLYNISSTLDDVYLLIVLPFFPYLLCFIDFILIEIKLTIFTKKSNDIFNDADDGQWKEIQVKVCNDEISKGKQPSNPDDFK